jgi:hypothetical protein
MKKLIEVIKKHKTALVFILVFAIIIVAIIISLFAKEPETIGTLSPLILKPEDTNIKSQNYFELKSFSPPNGQRETPDFSESLKFTFTEPIDATTAKVSVVPGVKITAKVYERDPYTLYIFPEIKSIWKPYTNYTITILDLSSTNGAKLNSKVTYRYYNEPPKDGIQFFD